MYVKPVRPLPFCSRDPGIGRIQHYTYWDIAAELLEEAGSTGDISVTMEKYRYRELDGDKLIVECIDERLAAKTVVLGKKAASTVGSKSHCRGDGDWDNITPTTSAATITNQTADGRRTRLGRRCRPTAIADEENCGFVGLAPPEEVLGACLNEEELQLLDGFASDEEVNELYSEDETDEEPLAAKPSPPKSGAGAASSSSGSGMPNAGSASSSGSGCSSSRPSPFFIHTNSIFL